MSLDSHMLLLRDFRCFIYVLVNLAHQIVLLSSIIAWRVYFYQNKYRYTSVELNNGTAAKTVFPPSSVSEKMFMIKKARPTTIIYSQFNNDSRGTGSNRQYQDVTLNHFHSCRPVGKELAYRNSWTPDASVKLQTLDAGLSTLDAISCLLVIKRNLWIFSKSHIILQVVKLNVKQILVSVI